MNTNEKRVSMRAMPNRLPTHNRPLARSAPLALALAAVIALSVLPGYSSNRSEPLATGQSHVEPQDLNLATDVVPILDTERAVTQVISTEGGNMIATASDGTLFILTFPPDALISDAEITMTPVSFAEGLPVSGGLVAAVRLEPEGLRLWEPATLLISPTAPVSVTEEFPFVWRGMGKNFHLYPLQPDPSSLAMKVVRLITYGIGRGTDADRAAQRLREMSRPEDQMEQRLEEVLSEARQAGNLITETEMSALALDSGCSSHLSQTLVPVFRNAYKKFKKPMKSALKSKDESRLRCVSDRAFGWVGQARSMGVLDCVGSEYLAVLDFLVKATKIQLDKAYDQCADMLFQPRDAIRAIGLLKQARRLGIPSQDMEKLKRCAKMEMEFDSATTYANGAMTIGMHVYAKVNIDPFYSDGYAPLEYLSFTAAPSCGSATIHSYEAVTPFKVLSVNFDVNPRTVDDCEKPNRDESIKPVSIDIEPSTTAESFDVICPRAPVVNIDGAFWTGSFFTLHQEELMGTLRFKITGWESGIGSLMARWTSNRLHVVVGVSVSGRTTINLWHRPE
ncbi:MAG: hypothetical protein AB1631_20195 [Acidobacteriota bacterium]